ncbi:Imm61 family immunity protein [Mycolicibacterium sp. 050158]|uniref:Imm61 family immunity protein n=1 Tax=Mycolicibacterium sp. 050158 TaxID=3090602 RepID=UPI0039A77FC8
MQAVGKCQRIVGQSGGRVSGISTLVRLSHLLSNSLEDMKISFEDPGGHPLFALR